MERQELPSNMTTNEVAAFLRVVPETVRYWRHLGTGPKSVKIGRRVIYRREDVLDWFDSKYAAEAS